MQVVDTIEGLRIARHQLFGRVGLVPTMGALHVGHLSLVEQARLDNDVVIVTIFVNPTQFSPSEDLDAYPRDLDGDLHKLRQAGVDLVFTPTPDRMYPPGHQTYVEVTEATQGLEGARRPTHFRGVTTVVAKLFNLTQPDAAYFGQKDAQQAAVLQRMVRDLSFPLIMVICPTVREVDGLAMSSRNVYLSAEERQAATVLYRALQAAGEAYAQGERHSSRLLETMRAVLDAEPLADPDYISAVSARTLRELEVVGDEPLLLSLAVQVGAVHLIDNFVLPSSLNNREGLSATLGGG